MQPEVPLPLPVPSALRRPRVPLAERAARPYGILFWILSALAIVPIWLIVRSDFTGYFAGTPLNPPVGFLLLYIGTIGVFQVLGRQYIRVLRWRRLFPNFVGDTANTASAVARTRRAVTKLAKGRWETTPLCIAGCALLGVTAAYAFARGGFYEPYGGLDYYLALAFVFGAGWSCAIGLAALVQLARVTRVVARSGNLRVTSHKFGVLSAGTILTNAFIEAAAVWCCFTASAAFCPRSWLIPVMALAFPTAVGLIVLYFFAQWPLHRAMVQFKAVNVRRLEEELKRFDSSAPYSDETRKQAAFIEQRIAAILALPEWPCPWPSVLSVSGSTAVSVVAPLLTKGLLGIVPFVRPSG